jgi:hypothetical protein
MKTIYLTSIFLLFSTISVAQINSGDKVWLKYLDTPGEVSVNGTDACNMLRDYVENKTTLILVENKKDADYIFVLEVIQKNMGDRKCKISISDPKSDGFIFESDWKRGTMNALYGFSGTRHSIGRVFNGQILKKFNKIKK